MYFLFPLNARKKDSLLLLQVEQVKTGRWPARRLYSRNLVAHVKHMSLLKILALPIFDRATTVSHGEADSARASAPNGSDAQRLAWLDAAKGVGIILVVYGHQLRAQMAAGKVEASWSAPLQDAVIYAFHMPLFFFISGLTIERTFRKSTSAQFVHSRLVTLIYPYILWSLISLGLAMAGQRYVNHQVGMSDVIAITWKPVFQYWFLYALFICQMVAFCVGMRHFIIALIAIAALLSPFDMRYPILVEATGSFPFFAAGILLSSHFLKSINGYSPRSLAVCGVVSATAFLVLFSWRGAAYFNVPLFKFILAVCGIATVVAFSAAFGARSRLLAVLGATSMAIFILHTIVATAIRSALNVLPWLDTSVIQLVCCVAGAVIIPVGIQRAVSMIGLERQLGLSGPNNRRRA